MHDFPDKISVQCFHGNGHGKGANGILIDSFVHFYPKSLGHCMLSWKIRPF